MYDYSMGIVIIIDFKKQRKSTKHPQYLSFLSPFNDPLGSSEGKEASSGKNSDGHIILVLHNIVYST